MDKFSVFSSRLVDKSENFTSGHRACQGCAEALAVRHVMKALGRDTIVAMATGCMEIISSPLPLTSWKVPWIHNAFENPSAVISGCESGMKAMMRKGKIPQKKINFVAMGGDGATADIGMGPLSGALERGHDMVYVCYDNEAYMNTGVQRSSSTPWGASTMTTPGASWKRTQKKNIVEIMAAHRIPYTATANIAFPEDLERKLRKARSIRSGLRFIHLFASCPTGWGFAPADAIKISRMAVLSRAFPLYEVEEGERYTINSGGDAPVYDYLRMQNRFRRLSDGDIAMIQEHVNREWERLNRKARG